MPTIRLTRLGAFYLTLCALVLAAALWPQPARAQAVNADLSITADADAVNAGDAVLFTVILQNTGDQPATNLVLDLTLAGPVDTVRARLEAMDAVRRLIERGHHDDGQMHGAGIGLQPAADLEAVHFRHHDVEQHHVAVAIGADFQRVAAVGSRQHLKVLGHEPGFQKPDIGLDIINNQNSA